jgi:cytochrome b
MAKKSRILVWDVPTRAFHWLLALSFTGAFVTAESERYRDVHVLLGYTVLGLVVFRLVWGLVGTRYARFRSFAYGPRSVLTYVKSLFTRSPQHYPGHNPAGSWAIHALLALGLLAGASGYATYNDVGGHWLENAHEALANAMLGLVLVHLAGVLVSSLLHRENLVRSMLDGYKSGSAGQGIRSRHRLVAAALVAAVTGFWIAGPDSLPAVWNSTGPSAAAETQHSADRRDD